MRIMCPHCQSKTIVTHTVKVSAKITDLYTTCTNHECGARSVMRMAHAYDLTPPASTLTDAMHEIIANMPDQERIDLLKQYAPPVSRPPSQGLFQFAK